MDRYMIVAPHPDDETLGAGGLILRKKAEGKEVFILNMTDVDVSYGYSEGRVEERSREIKKMTECYGVDDYFDLKLKPAGLDTYSEGELVSKVGDVFKDVRPTAVVLPYYNDVHSDHRITFNVCYACTKSFRYNFIKKVLMMEIPSETDFSYDTNGFVPNYFVDISAYVEKKIQIARIFKSEVSQHPFPRSEENIRAYGTIRGAQMGVESAEAFSLVKWME